MDRLEQEDTTAAFGSEIEIVAPKTRAASAVVECRRNRERKLHKTKIPMIASETIPDNNSQTLVCRYQAIDEQQRRRRHKHKLNDNNKKIKHNMSIGGRTSPIYSAFYLLLLVLEVLELNQFISDGGGSHLVGAQRQLAARPSLKANRNNLPDLVSSTSDEPIVAVIGQDAFISCVAKNLQNYTIIWRYTNEANAPAGATGPTADQESASSSVSSSSSSSSNQETPSRGGDEAAIVTAGKQRVIADDRFSVIQSHDTWLLKISNVRLSDTGTYICQTNSDPKVRALRILSVIKPNSSQSDTSDSKQDHFEAIDYNFTDCCRAEYVVPRCQRLCSFQSLSSRYQSINIVHECYSSLPSITRCMVAGRNVTDCCQKRHIPSKCNPMCGHQGDTSAMSVQDQSFCADYSASIMSCVAEGINTLPGQPELVIVEAISSTVLKVSWQKVTDESELRKIDGWIINLTKLSSFEDTISSAPGSASTSSETTRRLSSESKATQQTTSSSSNTTSSVSSSFSSSSASQSGSSSPLASLTIVDVMSNSSLAAMTKLLAASSGTISLKLDKKLNEYNIDNLKPYTVYQVQMFAYNSLGRSQLTDPIRALTLAPESEPSSSSSSSNEPDAYVEPSLPDTRKCCLDRGVTLKRCLDTLCDPVEADRATIADLMICAPWSNVTFSCLASKKNHTDCCKSRGVSPFCLSMCGGEIKRVDYRHFRCLTHMSTFTNCILESHNVLPSAPQNFTVGPITSSWAVLNWRPPSKHAQSLQGYRIFWRRVEPASQRTPLIGSNGTTITNRTRNVSYTDGDSTTLMNDEFYYSSAEAATNPYLLDALQPLTVYETFVVAVNKFGQSESSVRFFFQTLDEQTDTLQGGQSSGGSPLSNGEIESRLPLHGDTKVDSPQSYYNETSCCVNSGVHNYCQQLCDYDLKVADVSSLITSCNTQMPVILRCMAGSRNSVPCCRNRGVSDQCLNVCAGLTEHSPLVVATRCATDFGKIIRCMDEGSKQIPAAPVDLHTKDIQPDRITIKWSPANEDALRTDIEYHVRYQQLQQPADQATSEDPSSLIAVVPLHPLEHNLILTTNKTEATIDSLRPNNRYSIYVTAENPYGISLPSLVLVAQTPSEKLANDDPARAESFKRQATLGAPHSLEILRSDTESIVLKWIAPLFINSDAQIKYRVFYKLLGSQNSTSASEQSTSGSSPNGGGGSGAVQQISSNWTVVETTDTSLLLRNLKYSSQYAITVQAFSKQMLGHMSEILLAATAKPVPPTLNHPLVINNPIEGNNITIMCVALGQPTPQISMFINGLLVQKRTQPYVIYHLVNLVRGHLTITCFASNGHGKDYASVQSRTEVSVKFPSRATAKAKDVRAHSLSTARLTCEVTGNPQPTVVWTFMNQDSDNSSTNVVQANERVTTLLVSQFENPFTWSHTLTIRNVSKADSGAYQCRSRNLLSESMDSIKLFVSDNSDVSTSSSSSASSSATSSSSSAQLSNLKQLEQNSDLMECCRSQNVSSKCLPVCSVDGLDVETAFKTVECQPHLDRLMYCAADGSDHRNCCRTRQVPSSCLRWCSGAKLNIPALCFLSSALDINQCFQEGRTLLPGPPRNVRVLLASESEHADREMETPEVATVLTSGGMGAGMFSQVAGGSQLNTNMATDTNGNSIANTSNNNSSSVISSMAMMMGDGHGSGSPNVVASTTSGSSDESPGDGAKNSEPLVIEWDAPSKNPSLVQYYRIFWRPFGSRELSRTVTNLTWIKLNDLNMNKQYEFVVKAANQHGSSVYSDPLIVKPAEIISSRDLASVGMIWFIPSSGATNLIGRVLWAICFATMFMFSSLALVMFLERRGYLKRFASSKSNSSRISFANPAYSKDSTDGSNQDGDNITWDSGHSLDVLALPPQDSSASQSSTTTSSNDQK